MKENHVILRCGPPLLINYLTCKMFIITEGYDIPHVTITYLHSLPEMSWQVSEPNLERFLCKTNYFHLTCESQCNKCNSKVHYLNCRIFIAYCHTVFFC